MSRFRGGPGGAGPEQVRRFPTSGVPSSTAPAGSYGVNVFNDVYVQLDRPSGRNWVKIQTGYKPPLYVHNDQIPCSTVRPIEIRVNGTTNRDGGTPGTLLVSNATPASVASNNTVGVYNQTGSNGECLLRTAMGVGEDTAARFTACYINVGSPFRILQMGVYCVDGTNVTTLRGKFGIYQAACHYTHEMPWKIYPSATLSVNQASPQSNYRYQFAWDAGAVLPVISDFKFFVKAYWSNVGSGSGPYLLARQPLDMTQYFKSDRSRTYDVGEAYATPDWTTVYNFTSSVGSPDSGLGKSSVLYWFMVEPL